MKEQRVEMSASDWAMFEADLDLFLDKVIETADKHLMNEVEKRLKKIEQSVVFPENGRRVK